MLALFSFLTETHTLVISHVEPNRREKIHGCVPFYMCYFMEKLILLSGRVAGTDQCPQCRCYQSEMPRAIHIAGWARSCLSSTLLPHGKTYTTEPWAGYRELAGVYLTGPMEWMLLSGN